MKRKLAGMFLAAGLMALGAGCSTGPAFPPDELKIADVQSTPIANSAYTSYKLKVNYTLKSAREAVVTVGFDLEQPGRYIILAQQNVSQGSGAVEMSADVRLPDRDTVTLHADLSRRHHPPEWRSLASDDRVLTIAK